MAEFSNPASITSTGQAGAIPVAYTDTATRLGFLRKVYMLFSASVVVWAGTALYAVTNETLLLKLYSMLGTHPIITLMVLLGIMFLLPRVVSMGSPINYIALGAFGVVQGLLTAPLIFAVLASTSSLEVQEATQAAINAGTLNTSQVLQQGTGLLTAAFALTGIVFGGLTAYALTTKRDFSFMRGALALVFFVMFGIGVLSMFGIGQSFVMGWGWSAAWVLLMGGFVLYDTQNIMKNYPANQAALAAAMLLANFVIMFQRILMLLSRARN
jgi:modulator of FtsH protease